MNWEVGDMKKRLVRAVLAAIAVLLALSLAGCIMKFTIVGKDDYDVYVAGLEGGPAKVLVSISGFIPKWPDVLILTIRGDITNTGMTSGEIDLLADSLAGTMYGHLDFDSHSGTTFQGDPFWIEKEIPIPSFWTLLPIGAGGKAAIGPVELDLSSVIGETFYNALIAEMELLCDDELPYDTIVDLTLEGSLETFTGRVIGTLDCDFTLHALLI
jgi:hypothetical protein